MASSMATAVPPPFEMPGELAPLVVDGPLMLFASVFFCSRSASANLKYSSEYSKTDSIEWDVSENGAQSYVRSFVPSLCDSPEGLVTWTSFRPSKS